MPRAATAAYMCADPQPMQQLAVVRARQVLKYWTVQLLDPAEVATTRKQGRAGAGVAPPEPRTQTAAKSEPTQPEGRTC